jgi:hypothetical protein
MTFQMRKDFRRSVDRLAWINVGDGLPPRRCTLVDVSVSGAKLAFENNDGIPDTFGLMLSRFAQPACSCQVIWRRDNAIGVQFVRRAAPNKQE